jgi:hypothetical protein
LPVNRLGVWIVRASERGSERCDQQDGPAISMMKCVLHNVHLQPMSSFTYLLQ